MSVLEKIQQRNAAPLPPPTPEPAARPVQQPPPQMLALQPQVLLTPLALPTAAVQKPAHPPCGVHPCGKAPRAMADIRAYQRAHRDPTFSVSESDEEKQNKSEPEEHERPISSTQMQAV